MRNTLVIGLGALGFAATSSGAAETEGVEFFRNEVKPILEQNCFKCHGGVDEKGHPRVRGGLQLISRKGLMKGGAHGPSFNETDPAKSPLLEAISYKNEDLQMPPRGKLPDEDLAKITRWLEMGAPWTPEDADVMVEIHDPLAGVTEVNEKTKAHWSYKPMERHEPPKVSDPAWSENPVDAFIRAKLDEKGLQPVGEASKAALLRRLSYDLTGLPPSLEEIRSFEADTSPDAWSKQVDRLLAAPQYGEKWARHWLDIVRYAESNGFERDNEKPFVWRYRDYVIRSFNSDKPYDRFVAEQIAGDELPDKTADSQVATGMLRLMAWDDEPADRKQHFYDVMDDNVRTVTEGFLAMTAGCARCHDHKGDPIPQSDYFKFVSFFRGTEPMGKGGKQTQFIQSPELAENRGEQLAEFRAEEKRIRDWMARTEQGALNNVNRTRPEIAARVSNIATTDRWLVTDARTRPTTWHYTTQKPAEDWSSVGFRAENANWQQGPAGFGTAAPGVQARTVWTGSDIWLQTTFGLEAVPKSVLLHLYHDEDIEIYLNGQPVLQREHHVAEYEQIKAPREFMAALQTGRNVLSVHVRQTAGGQFFDLGLEVDAVTPSDLVLNRQYRAVARKDRETYRRGQARLEEIEQQKKSPGIEAMVITEVGPVPPPTHIHLRGSAHAEGDEVQPGFPAIWGGAPAPVLPPAADAKSSGRRLALAKWMTQPDNPRTARVMVNRIWQHHFNRGLSPTPNDFGYLGTAPTHPELLDWLATEFVAKGWSVKAMHRLLLNSKAYKLSIASNEKDATVDPANDFFWRFNPRRLGAEELRDSILLSTGELNLEMSGPSVFVPMPEEVLATSSTKGGKWGVSPPDQANRRSVYVKIKRSLQPPMFTDFDLADTDTTCPTRFTTTVPTQALAMMNSEFIHEKATALAKRLEQEHAGDLQAQVKRAFELVVSRQPDESEVIRSLAFINQLKTENQLAPELALQRFAVAVFSFNEFFYLD
ncbi:PSD1 and planctomycete cytochrome C domain-containing protein [Luteolibacter flavescens]|uniref:PSD1 and planctomycete cytochrome C domain-containing protein n=1 Tax=Luteolibacter flavescens TaxID=1859460 RepID=A0ABT3FSW2_9BACT|nr:PSD1 and planctomycete cytochrome C domain-containing protein [Luteolibacter flavescens]MCW1886637.1 PSD1 and planctomycete cytochrome C domain-containing protein [Luteolibacter flavescens]